MTIIAALEDQLEGTRATVERREAVLRLFKNRDFRSVILESFCKEECARYAQESADPAISPENRADALAMAQAAGHLRRFLQLIVVLGNNAEGVIPDLEQMIVNVEAEQNEGAN